MSFPLAAYAACIDDGRVLLAHHVSKNWTLPGVLQASRLSG